MAAPDKTYPLSIVGDLLASTPPEEVVYMTDKIYFDGVDTSTTPRLAINEEYIRKDALIEWAKEHQEGERQGSYTWSCYQIFIDKLNSM